MKKLTKQNIREIKKLRNLFPQRIRVSVSRESDGKFLARVDEPARLFTEGSSFSELIEMVNDAMKTYFEVKKAYLPYMPNYMPPIKAAQQLDIFPVRLVKKTIVLPLATSEKTAR